MKVSAQLLEEYSLTSLKVEGHIPDWLEGTLVRNGPVHVSVQGQVIDHWFDGLAMLHAFSIYNGQVSYNNKFLKTEAYQKVFKEGNLDYQGFAMDPCKNLFKKIITLFSSKTHIANANVNVAIIKNEYVALTEIPLPVQFDIETLDTVGVFRYEDELPQNNIWQSAHPHIDKLSLDLISYYIEYGKTSYYVIYKTLKDSNKREVIAKIAVDEPSYMHSFAVTENYVILVEFPFRVNPRDMFIFNKPFIYNFKWENNGKTIFKIISKQSGRVEKEMETESFFSFHHINAYEENGHIVLDMVVYEDAAIVMNIKHHVHGDSSEELKSPSVIKRFIIGNEISTQILFSEMTEFPRINELFDGKKYRYCYLVNPFAPQFDNDVREIFKLDLNTHEVWRWSEKGAYPGEPIFVAKPSAKEEDEGVILNIVVDDYAKRSYLLILDAQTFKEMARVLVDHIIPPGLHGQFFP